MIQTMNQEMKGLTCLITGASQGIGYFTARGLAALGAHVVLVGHNTARGEGAVTRLRQEVPGASAAFIQADLSSQQQIRHLAETFHGRYDRLDVLINNAGAFFWQRQHSADGIEMTLALNHLGAFLLTHLLLDLLAASAPARVINISSAAHRWARMHWDDMQLRRGYNGLKAYAQSKLANLLFTYALARRLEHTGVTANALHPGFIDTKIGDRNRVFGPILNRVRSLFAKSPEEGAETPIYLASSPEVAEATGGYYIDQAPARSCRASRDLSAAARLWRLSEELCRISR